MKKLNLVLFFLVPSILFAADTTVSNFTEFENAVNNSSEDDVIIVDDDISFSGSVVVDNQIKIIRDENVSSATLFTNGNDFIINSKSGGNSVEIVGLGINSSGGTALKVVADVDDLTFEAKDVSFTSSNGYGVRVDAESTYNVTVTFIGCNSKDNNYDGYAVYNQGSGASTMYLWYCTADGNHVGADCNDAGSTLYIIGGRFWDNDLRCFVSLSNTSTYVKGLHANQPFAYAQNSQGTVEDVLIDYTDTDSTASAFLCAGGTDVTISDSVFNLTYTGAGVIFDLSGSDILVDSCKFNLLMAEYSGSVFEVGPGKDLTMTDCIIDVGTTSLSKSLFNIEGSATINYGANQLSLP